MERAKRFSRKFAKRSPSAHKIVVHDASSVGRKYRYFGSARTVVRKFLAHAMSIDVGLQNRPGFSWLSECNGPRDRRAVKE